MISIQLKQLIQILNGSLYLSGREADHHPELAFTAISTDSRQSMHNALFIALKGEQFDGHDYCQSAVENGASALIVSQLNEGISVPQLLVQNTTEALGAIAAWHKAQLAPFTLALTGSCGKTTVKEMVASILSLIAPTLATAGNFNNEIGVPLTLLNLNETHRYAVIEQGANHLGEIKYTSHLIHADLVLINNIAAAHMEGFGSIEGVATAKGEIFYNFDPAEDRLQVQNSEQNKANIALVNLDSHTIPLWRQLYRAQLEHANVLTFAQENEGANFYASEIALDSENHPLFTLNSPQGSIDITLALLGKHNVTNAIAAASLSLCAGATLDQVKAGLERLQPVKGRTEALTITPYITLIDDSYNASVSSMLAAIDLLSSYDGLKLLLLADMAELGEESQMLHQQVADHISLLPEQNRLGLTVYSYGNEARVFSEALGSETDPLSPSQHLSSDFEASEEAYGEIDLEYTASPSLHFTTHDALLDAVKLYLSHNQNQQVTLLTKGAHRMHMDDFTQRLRLDLQTKEAF